VHHQLKEPGMDKQRASTDTAVRPHIPGEVGIWVFVLGDMCAFAVFFNIFMLYRAKDVELFAQSQSQLNQNYGAINTLLLLASSWFVVRAMSAARSLDTRRAPRYFEAAIACGFGFMVVKYLEWSEKITHGVTVITNDFFSFYYMLTGIHFLHVIFGMLLLFFLRAKSKKGLETAGDLVALESGATYWHMVDVLWIVLFPLIYLLK
jgi:nitric oxide reductase NorE protein